LVCAAVAALLLPVRAQATSRQTVAVMPFRDLTARAKAHVGEAIREVVTNDLKQISDLRVVERGSLDKVLSELKLQVQARDLDNATLARVGKILGASVIVIGAYQEATPLIRLTARFVKVETSEVVGSAKVDGSVRGRAAAARQEDARRCAEPAGSVEHEGARSVRPGRDRGRR
jgi:TolB-like protein